MILNRTVAPAQLMSTIAAKSAIQVWHSDDDLYIDGLIKAAAEYLDGPYGAVGKALVQQTWQIQSEPVIGRCEWRFPIVPLISVTSISYFDADNAAQSISIDDVIIYKEEDRAWMVPNFDTTWPTMYRRDDAMTVTAQFGFGGASDVPQNIIHAAKLLVGHWYENRDATAVGVVPKEIDMGVKSLIGVSRIGWVA